ncbi:MAG: manganese efflux pump MntP family protein [Desulfobacteraceae bacterium]
MTLINVLAIAVALAMDAFAVAIATGICLGSIHWRQNFRLAWHFGLFQAMMPVIGWIAGLTVRDLIANYDHWVAFGLLLFVSQSMFREALKKDDACETVKDPTKGWTMVMLSVATSLDALAVGLSLSVVNVTIWMPAVIIGIVACIFTTFGLHLGRYISKAAPLRRAADCLGAAVLLLIGLNILREHGVFSGLM